MAGRNDPILIPKALYEKVEGSAQLMRDMKFEIDRMDRLGIDVIKQRKQLEDAEKFRDNLITNYQPTKT